MPWAPRHWRFCYRKSYAFDEAYDAIDWSEFADYPAFDATNRRNAYGVYLSLEQEMMGE